MKNLYLFLLLIPVSFVFGQNLVQNGGMEDWTDEVLDVWTSEPGTEISQDFVHFSEGATAANFHVITETQGNTDFRQTIPVEIGRTYAVSVDIYHMDNAAKARIYATDWAPEYSDAELVNEWQTITYEFTAATGVAEVGLRFYDIPPFFDTELGSYVIADNYIVECLDCDGTASELYITSPVDGAVLAAGTTEVVVEFVVNNFEVGTADSGADGHIHYTVDGGNTVMYYSEDPFTVSGLEQGDHEIHMWLVDNNHEPFEPNVHAYVDFSIPSEIVVSSIAELREGAQDGSIYTLSTEAILTMQQNFRGQKWIQDATGGILIDDNAGNITTTFNRYDGITGLSGTISEHQGVMQLIPASNPDVATSTGNIITPEVVSVADFNANPDAYESRLIKIENLTTSETGDWTGGVSYNFMASEVPEDMMIVRANFYDADYIGTALPSETVHIVGIASEFNGAAQIFPRDSNDILDNLSVLDPSLNTALVKVAVANNELKIAGFDAKKIAIYNSNGQLVSTSTSVGSLHAGTYIAVMKNAEGQMVNVKFIKK